MAGAGPVHRVAVPPGVQPDQVEGDRGVGVFQAGLGQPAVAGVPHAGDGHALADGAFDARAQGVSGLEVPGVLGGPGGELGFVDLLGVHGELAAPGRRGRALGPDWGRARRCSSRTVLLLTLPVVMIAILMALPFVSNQGDQAASRRPFSVLLVIFVMLSLYVLANLGLTSPWSPHMEAWSGTTVPLKYLKGRTPLEIRGALVLQNKDCRNCHSLGHAGGERGPALDGVATRLTVDQMVRQVIQGGGNMPAYGKNLKPAEVTALVSFMETLRPDYEPAVRDATAPPAPGSREQQVLRPNSP